MAQIYADRVADTSQTVGAGPIGLTGFPPQLNLRTFSDVMQPGDSAYIAVVNRVQNEWEVGIYTYTGINQLTARAILQSSNGNGKVTFSAGMKDVFITIPALVAFEADQAAIGAHGNAILDFSSTPSTNASVVISAPGIQATSSVNAWIMAQPTVDHTITDHTNGPRVTAGNISTAPASFTIYGVNTTALSGKWNVGWSWQ